MIYIYARFSPRRHEEDCESIEVQVDRCQRYANLVGLEVDHVCTDKAISGGVPLAERPSGRFVTNTIKRGDHLIAQRVDRMFRDAADGIAQIREWTRLGVTIHLADQGGCSIDCSKAVGRFMIAQLLVMAEFEKDLTGEKTSGAMKHHQRNGRRMSHHAPYGWQVDPDDRSRLIEDEEEQVAVKAIVQMRDGGNSYGDIAECLQCSDDVYTSRSGQCHS